MNWQRPLNPPPQHGGFQLSRSANQHRNQALDLQQKRALKQAINDVMRVIIEHHSLSTNVNLDYLQAAHQARQALQLKRNQNTKLPFTFYRVIWERWIDTLSALLTTVTMLPKQPRPLIVQQAYEEQEAFNKWSEKRSNYQERAAGAGKLRMKQLQKKSRNLNQRYFGDRYDGLHGQNIINVIQEEVHRLTDQVRVAEAEYRLNIMNLVRRQLTYQAWLEACNDLKNCLLPLHQDDFEKDEFPEIEGFLVDLLVDR